MGSNSEGFQPSLPPPTPRPQGDLGDFIEQSDLPSYFMHEEPGSGGGGVKSAKPSRHLNPLLLKTRDQTPPPHTRALQYAANATDGVVHPP